MWEHEYDPPARWVLLNRLGPILGARLDAAVIAFARTGRGNLTKVEHETRTVYRLRAEGAAADLFVDVRARRFWVIRVFRTG